MRSTAKTSHAVQKRRRRAEVAERWAMPVPGMLLVGSIRQAEFAARIATRRPQRLLGRFYMHWSSVDYPTYNRMLVIIQIV
jgi:hypothetical protein